MINATAFAPRHRMRAHHSTGRRYRPASGQFVGQGIETFPRPDRGCVHAHRTTTAALVAA